jgi:hypothetical protein
VVLPGTTLLANSALFTYLTNTEYMNSVIKHLTILNFASRKTVVAGVSAVIMLGFGISAQADLVINGGFESTTNGAGQLGFNTDATGWTVAPGSYNFIFASGTADTSGSIGQYGGLTLWGPNDGSANGLPASSPAGGNYVAADGAYDVGAISQTISGLTAGDSYTVGFWWAGAQQHGYTSNTTEQWTVGFGSQTQSTAIVDDANHGFTGWQHQTFNFTADGPSDVLSFLAAGTPNGEPPFSLLDGVSVASTSETPEPGYLALTLGLLSLMAVVVAYRSRNAIKS